jgi:hypothetical protein
MEYENSQTYYPKQTVNSTVSPIHKIPKSQQVAQMSNDDDDVTFSIFDLIRLKSGTKNRRLAADSPPPMSGRENSTAPYKDLCGI